MDIEDKVLLVNPIGENAKVFVFHQAAQRLIRKDIVQNMKKNIKELNSIDLDDLVAEVENHSVEVEKKLIGMLSQ
jgi:hypothetical protein